MAQNRQPCGRHASPAWASAEWSCRRCPETSGTSRLPLSVNNFSIDHHFQIYRLLHQAIHLWQDTIRQSGRVRSSQGGEYVQIQDGQPSRNRVLLELPGQDRTGVLDIFHQNFGQRRGHRAAKGTPGRRPGQVRGLWLFQPTACISAIRTTGRTASW